MIVEMRIVSLLIDPNSGLPIVVLMENSGERALPIVIGLVEAEAIALALQGVEQPRPRTHDLLKEVLVQLGGRLERIVVNDLRESTFYARLHVRRGRALVEIDSRPSDAMALAARTGAKIYVAEDVLQRAHVTRPKESDATEEEGEEAKAELRPLFVDSEASGDDLTELLQNLKPEDFGKYKM